MRNLTELSFLSNCFVAGGSILSLATKTDINDYDIYPKTKESIVGIILDCVENDCFIVGISDKAVTMKCNTITNSKNERAIIQVMIFEPSPSAEKIFEKFDFTVCMAAYDCDDKNYVFHKDFYPDIASKTLRFNVNTKYPLNSLIRVNKYYSKGYFISKPELIKLALTVASRGMPQSWEELEVQIGGSYGKEIKINSEGKEFSFEAAIELLSNLNVLDTNYTASFDWVKENEIEMLFTDKIYKYVDIEGQMNVSKLHVENGFILGSINQNLHADYNIKFEKHDDLLYGYKYVIPDGVNTFKPANQHKSNICYSLGDRTEENIYPYIFVYCCKKPENSYETKGKTCIKVSFKSSDIKTYGSDGSVTVSKLITEEIC